jgi:hypothetical protein
MGVRRAAAVEEGGVEGPPGDGVELARTWTSTLAPPRSPQLSNTDRSTV